MQWLCNDFHNYILQCCHSGGELLCAIYVSALVGWLKICFINTRSWVQKCRSGQNFGLNIPSLLPYKCSTFQVSAAGTLAVRAQNNAAAVVDV